MSTGEFVELNKENEHILVCLSSSPSNEKIIRTAAKMARDMRARFTALYVQTGKRERESDKRRLEAHVQFAKESGAEIVMTHGENVPVQIAEYAHLSNVTKIVIGQSSAKRNHFFSKQTLTEKLIEAVPDIDIHIIPDAMNLDNYRKPHGAVYVGKPTMKDSLLTLFIFAVCTLIGLFIRDQSALIVRMIEIRAFVNEFRMLGKYKKTMCKSFRNEELFLVFSRKYDSKPFSICF